MAHDIPSISDLEAIQLLNKHYAEVVTSKKDGVASGLDITQTTNPITGVTRRTLYKILDDMDVEHNNQMQSFENDFDSRLAGMAFTRVGTFAAGATLTDMRQTLLWEASQGGDGHEYGWTGSFLPSGKVVAAGSTPATSGGIGAGAWVDRTDVTLRAELLSNIGAGLVGYQPAGTGAVATTVQAKLRESVSVLDFYANGVSGPRVDPTGVIDSTAGIQAALNVGGLVYLPTGTYKITRQLVFSAACTGLYGDGQYHSVISKQFNGNAILCDTAGAAIEHIGIVGNGATYTGGGIVPRGYNILIQHCRISDTADSPIMVEGSDGSNSLAATYLRVDSCFLNATNVATTYAIRSVSADDSIRPTARVFSNISGGSSLVDFSGMNYAVLENSLGGIIKFDNNCSKIRIAGCRFTNAAANITIYGQDHVIDGNIWTFGAGYGLTIHSTAAAVHFGPNNDISIDGTSFSSIIDGTAIGGGNFNNLSTQLKSYTPAWYGSTTNPTIGNGTHTGYYKQEGRLCFVTNVIEVGSTTNVGAGTYSFQLPFKANVTTVGQMMIWSTTGNYYTASAVVPGGSSVCYVYMDTATGAFASTSLALSPGAFMYLTMTYLISPT